VRENLNSESKSTRARRTKQKLRKSRNKSLTVASAKRPHDLMPGLKSRLWASSDPQRGRLTMSELIFYHVDL
jgi:hypothetical protein